jgi:hypothetical protein
MASQQKGPIEDPLVVFGREAPGPAGVGVDFRGIRIEQRRLVSGAPTPSRWIDGVVQMGRAEADALELRPIQRNLVITAITGYLFASWNPSAGRVLFADDEEDLGGVVRGRFGFKLSAFFDDGDSSPCSVIASAGPFLSEVLALQPRGTGT